MGVFWVDAACIDCDTCRWMAPETFDRSQARSRVHTQPASDAESHLALLAQFACPTASIHSSSADARLDTAGALRAFPLPIDNNVHHCGFHSEKSYGATSYLIVREQGNVLVDSPRFSRPLAERLEQLGGVKAMFLTHRDDVADHRLFRERFGCDRILHQADLTRDTRGVEVILEGNEEIPLADDLLVIPTPGHTRGSACLLHEQYLFSGDHLAKDSREDRLALFESVCWYDLDIQIESAARLSSRSFEWILPGHGRRVRYPRERMRAEIDALVRRMRAGRGG